MRRSKAIRAAAWALVGAGVAAPLLRRRVKAPALVIQTVAYLAPVGLAVAVRRSKTRDVAVCALQMWAYVFAYKQPHDDQEGQARRVLIEYPIVLDRVLGLGELPTVRLQRLLAHRDRWSRLDKVLVWAHWSWFLVPHGSLLYVMVRRPERFARSAVLTYSVFNIGAAVYWVLPTAPPWYAAVAHGLTAGEETDGHPAPRDLEVRGATLSDPELNRLDPQVRRMMVEYGEFLWKDGWGPLYSVFGGNPLAAMPSLHFATSLMAALLLSEVDPLAGAAGWSYLAALGFALVYLGEHYAVDLVAGAALTLAVRRWGPVARPALERLGSFVSALEAQAHAA